MIIVSKVIYVSEGNLLWDLRPLGGFLFLWTKERARKNPNPFIISND